MVIPMINSFANTGTVNYGWFYFEQVLRSRARQSKVLVIDTIIVFGRHNVTFPLNCTNGDKFSSIKDLMEHKRRQIICCRKFLSVAVFSRQQ